MCSNRQSRVCPPIAPSWADLYVSLVMSSFRNQDGSGPEPPKTLAIVIACVVGVVLLLAILRLVSMLG